MTRIAILVVTLASACATPLTVREIPRDDSWLTRSLPTRHTIEPLSPSTSPPAATAGSAFAAERVAIEEPTFDEPHPLQWQRDVAKYTADVLNRAAPEATGPFATTVRFSETFDRRDGTAVATAHIAIESALPDGSVVRSDEIKAPTFLVAGDSIVAMLGGVSGGLAVAGLIPAVDLVVRQPDNVTLTSPDVLAMLGFTAGAAVTASAAIGYAASNAKSDEERWSDLYLDALVAHAADVKKAAKVGVAHRPDGH